MSPRAVGFYVHHHGSGHANRTRLLADRMPPNVPVHVFTSAADRFAGWERGIVHALPPDTTPGRNPENDLLQKEILHYAPVDAPGLQERMARMATWIAEHRPALFVVDLSVEVLLLARLCGAPTALVRLHGHREDPAHQAAFRLAGKLIAPFPPALDDAHTPEWVRRKTHYLGAFSRYDGRSESRAACRRELMLPAERRVLTVINGTGGGAQEISRWEAVARSCPDWTLLLVGKLATPQRTPENLRCVGYVADTFPYLKAADVVVGSGGTNTMMEVGAARVPFLSLPEPRPFDEQLCKMRALERLGLTRIVEATLPAGEWGELLQNALDQDTRGWEEVFAWSPRPPNLFGEVG